MEKAMSTTTGAGGFVQIDPCEFAARPFGLFDKDWTLITVPKGDSANPMTASWGGLGFLWAKPVVYSFVRPQRFTHGLIDAAPAYSLAVLDGAYREQLKFCGTESGRDHDKIEECGFTLGWDGGAPYILQAHTVFICRKVAKYNLNPAGFIDTTVGKAIYPTQDYHDLYISAVEKVLVRKG
jgi:flavin reductase (DIM6/NTAB) family NADH-FMN oxidoreductase RutF